MADWIVSGAGSEEANGGYTYAGTFVGMPYYVNSGGCKLCWSPAAMRWIIIKGAAVYAPDQVLYVGQNVFDPVTGMYRSDLPANEWSVAWGAPPAPTVTAGSSTSGSGSIEVMVRIAGTSYTDPLSRLIGVPVTLQNANGQTLDGPRYTTRYNDDPSGAVWPNAQYPDLPPVLVDDDDEHLRLSVFQRGEQRLLRLDATHQQRQRRRPAYLLRYEGCPH